MYLIFLSCAWIAGILLGLVLQLPLPAALAGLLPLILIPFLKKHRKRLVLSGLCLAAIVAGAWYYRESLPSGDAEQLKYYNDIGIVEIRGLVARDPEQNLNNYRLQVEADAIKIDGEWKEISGTVLIYVPLYTPYAYGDYLAVRGKLQTPPRLDDFDYEQYLAVKGIYSTIYYPGISVLDTGKGYKPLEWIFSFRNKLSDIIDRLMPEPHASLMRGILLGMRGNIPEQVNADFRNTGTAHLLAISGLHLSIIAGMAITLGIRMFGRKGYYYVWLALAAVWIYAVITGLNPPVLRAAVMASMYLAAEFFGRQRSAMTALTFAAAVMAGFSPGVLRDASFQMSFAAMSGLVFIYPQLQAMFRKLIRSRFSRYGFLETSAAMVSDSLSISLGAVISVWPLLAYYFNMISPAGPFATFFAVPAMPGTIITGLLAGITGIFCLPAAQVFAWAGWLFTSWILLVVNLFSGIPPLEISGIGIAPVIAYYVLLVFLIIWLRKRTGREAADEKYTPTAGLLPPGYRKWVVTFLLAAAVFTGAAAAAMPDDKLHVNFLDVGQGDAILIQQGSRQILVDGGPDTVSVMTALGRKMPFWDRTIDLVVMTHPDSDHITGLIEVLRRYEVKQVLYPDIDYDSDRYLLFLDTLEKRGINSLLARAGQRISFGNGVIMDVLNPASSGSRSNIDDESTVLRLQTGEISFLLTGDITRETEFSLMSSRMVKESTVLKTAHHGSSTSTSAPFLNTVNPSVAIISAGRGNRFGHPSAEVMERLENRKGITVFLTGQHGTIEFITDGANLSVITENKYLPSLIRVPSGDIDKTHATQYTHSQESAGKLPGKNTGRQNRFSCLSGYSCQPSGQSCGGDCLELKYEENDSRLKEILPEKLKAERVAAGFGFTEGPVWCGDYLLFSDIPRNRIIRLSLLNDGPEITTFRRPSGNSNGLTLDRSGRLIACESTTRRLTRTELDGTITVLAERYRGRRLNSPNDVTVRSDGTVYFTDPFYLSGNPLPPEELNFRGVFRVTPGGDLDLLENDYIFPNGIAFSPDESLLYVNDTMKRYIRVYDVEKNGRTVNGRKFIEMPADVPGAPDGMKVDTKGNIYCTGPGGLWIISPEGRHLGTVSLPELPSNLCWGDADWRTLYVTARTSVYRLRLSVTGIAPYKVDPFPWE